MSHKVYITNKQNTVKVPSGLRILIRRSCHAVLEAEHFEGPCRDQRHFCGQRRDPAAEQAVPG